MQVHVLLKYSLTSPSDNNPVKLRKKKAVGSVTLKQLITAGPGQNSDFIYQNIYKVQLSRCWTPFFPEASEERWDADTVNAEKELTTSRMANQNTKLTEKLRIVVTSSWFQIFKCTRANCASRSPLRDKLLNSSVRTFTKVKFNCQTMFYLRSNSSWWLHK